MKYKLVFCLVLRCINVGRTYSSLAKDLKFDWSLQITWKQRALVNRSFIFIKQFIVLIWVIFTATCRGSSKYQFLKHFTQSRAEQLCQSLFKSTCYFLNKRLWHRRFLVDIAKLSRTPFLQEHLETPDSVFMEHICNYNIIKFNVN